MASYNSEDEKLIRHIGRISNVQDLLFETNINTFGAFEER